jgi:hypothetical protein
LVTYQKKPRRYYETPWRRKIQDINSRLWLQEEFLSASVFYCKGENDLNECNSFRMDYLTRFRMLTSNDARFVYVSPSGDWVPFPRSECVGFQYTCDHTVKWFPQRPVCPSPSPQLARLSSSCSYFLPPVNLFDHKCHCFMTFWLGLKFEVSKHDKQNIVTWLSSTNLG